MSDLKSKAEAAIAEVEEWKAAGEHWPQWNRRYLDFRSEATPEAVIALLAENEYLRKQLEARHPFKPAMDEITIGYTGCLICGKYTDHGGLQCPRMRAYSISSPENH